MICIDRMTQKEKQIIADKAARNAGFEVADFIGNIEQVAVFIAHMEDDETHPTGLPYNILIDDNGVVTTEISLKYLELLNVEE